MTTPTRKKKTLRQRAILNADRIWKKHPRAQSWSLIYIGWLTGYRAAQRDIKRSEVK